MATTIHDRQPSRMLKSYELQNRLKKSLKPYALREPLQVMEYLMKHLISGDFTLSSDVSCMPQNMYAYDYIPPLVEGDKDLMIFADLLVQSGFWIFSDCTAVFLPDIHYDAKTRVLEALQALKNSSHQSVRYFADVCYAYIYRARDAIKIPEVKQTKPIVKEDSNMKHHQIINLLQEGYKTIAVVYATQREFQDSGAAKRYTFKTMDESIKVDDHVVVLTSGKFSVVTVVEVHDVPQIDYDSGIQYTWIVQKLDMTLYNELLEAEKTALEVLKVAERGKQQRILREALTTDIDPEAREKLQATLSTKKRLK